MNNGVRASTLKAGDNLISFFETFQIRTKATLLEDISIYPEAPVPGNQSLLLGDDPDCEWIASFQERFFLAAHKHVSRPVPESDAWEANAAPLSNAEWCRHSL